ncbi:hypothetical protein GCM10017600_87280 [Streptosporangium carneum]|uniref:DUF4012 domain-containing protein n=2 Tax=Streptosporangium carneum TaxID=47481 RepID=A0A9W6IAX6_9ACTN|nr:hypothetical protein GCM10017600_87280 [Streptosporangium carneum]
MLAMAGSWSAYLGLSVRDRLEETRNALLRLRTLADAGDLGSMAGALAEARRPATEARRLTGGLDWAVIAHAPLVGQGATTVRGLAEGVAEVTEVLTEVLRDAQPLGTALAAGRTHSLGDVRRTLADLDAAAPTLGAAAARLAGVGSRLAATPAETGIDSLDQARETVLSEVDRLRGRLGDAATAATLLPPMLGHDGPRRYFLAFQTNAEARGTGGLVGAFGVLEADHGEIGIDGLSANTGLGESPTPVADYGPAYRGRYGSAATRMLSVSNLSPHFPYAAGTWAELWERQNRRRLDGAIATDPVGLSYLLELIGPVALPSGETLTAENVVDLTERAAYARYPDPRERKRFLVSVAGAVGDALTESSAGPARLFAVLSRMVGERRIQIWSRREAEQRVLAETPVGGVLPRRPGPFAGLVVNNSAGGKLDYYLERSLDYALGPCSGGTRSTKVSVRLTNDVPHGELPVYVTNRLDSPGRAHAVGSNLLWVSLYAGVGAELRAARLDGDRVRVISEAERSHPVYSLLLELDPRQSRTLELDLREPATAGTPLTPVQPLARPQRTRITQDARGCPVEGAAVRGAP